MKQFIPAITLLTLFSIEPSLHAGWGSKSNTKMEEGHHHEKKPVVNTPGFNLEDNRRGFVELDYLFWRPQLEDSFFATKLSSDVDSAAVKVKLKQPSFDLSSGVRLAIGGFTCDSWDIGLKGTYLYGDASKHVSTPGSLLLDSNINNATAGGQAFGSSWFQSILGNGTSCSAHWKMNFYTLDLAFGREYFMTKKFSVHPFIGLRGLHIDQKLHSRYHSIFQTSHLSALTRFHAKQDVWGVGPRLGIDLNFYFVRDWAFLGGLSGALLWTRSTVREKMFGDLNNANNTALTPFNARVNDTDLFGRANLDVYFGLGWDRWFNDGQQRVRIALLFEGSQWFQMNQWVDLLAASLVTGTNNNVRLIESKRHGDLSFIGGTVRVNIDF